MPEEKSPGGSVIHRYPANRWAEPRIGLEETALEFSAAREKVYRTLFGEPQSIYHELVPLLPHIDVHTYVRTNPEGNIYVLVTSGMSDIPMRVPPAAGDGTPRRTELIFYCAEPKQEYLETLRWAARFPHDQKTWLGSGHTVPNGNPPAPFWGSEILDTLLFMQTIVARDRELPKELVLAGDPVDFLWVVPLSTAECSLKLEQGFGAILSLFGKNRHPYVFAPGRKSYV